MKKDKLSISSNEFVCTLLHVAVILLGVLMVVVGVIISSEQRYVVASEVCFTIGPIAILWQIIAIIKNLRNKKEWWEF